ncbi:hypothetical protein Hanom_Chr00s000003g01601541 [Helianthus anomalus]
MQDKLTVNIGLHVSGNWQDIVMSLHVDADSKHLGFKETLERIEQVWTVGVKFYGIPESYIRATTCPLCSCSGLGLDESNKRRRRFEYTEQFEVSAKDVADKLQQLSGYSAKRKRYIKYKPFMAEVKDYACDRAGEPGSLGMNLGRWMRMARIVHSGFLMDQDFVYGTNDEVDDENFMGSENGDVHRSVLQQVKD